MPIEQVQNPTTGQVEAVEIPDGATPEQTGEVIEDFLSSQRGPGGPEFSQDPGAIGSLVKAASDIGDIPGRLYDAAFDQPAEDIPEVRSPFDFPGTGEITKNLAAQVAEIEAGPESSLEKNIDIAKVETRFQNAQFAATFSLGEDKGLVPAVKAVMPPGTDVEVQTDGSLIVTDPTTGERKYWNKPGISGEDFIRAGGAAVASFMPLGPIRVAAQGGFVASTGKQLGLDVFLDNMAVLKGAKERASWMTHAGGIVGAVVLRGMQKIGGAAVADLIGRVSLARNGNALSKQTKLLAEQMGVDLSDLTGPQLREFNKVLRSVQDPGAAIRAQEARQLGVDLTPGQASRQPMTLAGEALDGNIVDRHAFQQQQINEVIENKIAGGGAPRSASDLAAGIQNELATKARSQLDVVDADFDRIRDFGPVPGPTAPIRTFGSTMADINKRLRAGSTLRNLEDHPGVQKAQNRIAQLVDDLRERQATGVGFMEMERLRIGLRDIAKGAPGDADIIRNEITRPVRKWQKDFIKNKWYGGQDDEVAQTVLKGHKGLQRYKDIFEAGDLVQDLVDTKFVRGERQLNVSADKAINRIFAQAKFDGPKLTAQNIAALRDQLSVESFADLAHAGNIKLLASARRKPNFFDGVTFKKELRDVKAGSSGNAYRELFTEDMQNFHTRLANVGSAILAGPGAYKAGNMLKLSRYMQGLSIAFQNPVGRGVARANVPDDIAALVLGATKRPTRVNLKANVSVPGGVFAAQQATQEDPQTQELLGRIGRGVTPDILQQLVTGNSQ